ncbi:alpha/beta hydrolase family protein [Parahaliea aestuarii]
MLKKLLLLVVILVVVVAGLLTFGWQPQPFPGGSASAARAQPGPLAVASLEVRFEDTSRRTAANGDFAGAPSRVLEGQVWLPADAQGAPFPLLVYSHGFSSNHRGGSYMAEHLASLGYVVVAVDFPLTNMEAPGGPMVKDVVNQPADVSFVIDRMLARSASRDDPLSGRVDGQRIGVFGLSLGGMTTQLVAFHPEWRDERIAAALSIAGPSNLLGPAFFDNAPGLPFLMLAGDIDALVPWESNAKPVPGKRPGAELVTVAGASHAGFAAPAAYLRWLPNPDAVACYIVTRNIGEDMEDPWYDLLGTAEQGIIAQTENELCTMDPLPAAMNALRQQLITRVVVASFFERSFSSSGAEQAASADYLSNALAREIPEVEYRRSPQRALLSAQ